MANVVGVVLVGLDETARVASGSISVTVSVTVGVRGDVGVVAASSSGVSAVDPAVDRTAAAAAVTADLPMAASVEASVNRTSETVDVMNALSGIAALFSGKIPHARKPLLAVPGVAASPQASLRSDPN